MQIAMRLSGLLLSLSLALPAVTSAADGVADTALYWAVLRDGEPAGYLLGTIHSEDPRVLDFSESLIVQLGSVDLFAMEMVPDLPTLTRLTEYMQYQDGTRLAEVVGAERYARLQEALAVIGLSTRSANNARTSVGRPSHERGGPREDTKASGSTKIASGTSSRWTASSGAARWLR
mgnify:CR=1 FL=1